MEHDKTRKAQVGDAEVRMTLNAKGYKGVVIHENKIKETLEGADGDDIWRQLQDAAQRLNPLFIGYSSARARFMHFFANGFADKEYVGRERAYKLAAKAALEHAAPVEAVSAGSGFGEGVLAAFRKTNLLASFEQMRVQDLLRGPHADEFVRLCAQFADGGIKQPLASLKSLLKPYDCAKWTVITYLPFLWKPERNFFLKPMMVKKFAERVGHRFAQDYSPDLHPDVYASLLDLAQEVRLEVADMQPRDMIDVQSFMWTAVEYKEEDKSI